MWTAQFGRISLGGSSQESGARIQEPGVSIQNPISFFELHVSSVLASYFEEGLGDLAQGAGFAGFHEGFEDVFVLDSGVLYDLQGLGAFFLQGVQAAQHVDLIFFFFRGGADHFAGNDGG